MRHLWVVEEWEPEVEWVPVPGAWFIRDGVFFTRENAQDQLRASKSSSTPPKGWKYRVVKYVPEGKK